MAERFWPDIVLADAGAYKICLCRGGGDECYGLDAEQFERFERHKASARKPGDEAEPSVQDKSINIELVFENPAAYTLELYEQRLDDALAAQGISGEVANRLKDSNPLKSIFDRNDTKLEKNALEEPDNVAFPATVKLSYQDTTTLSPEVLFEQQMDFLPDWDEMTGHNFESFNKAAGIFTVSEKPPPWKTCHVTLNAFGSTACVYSPGYPNNYDVGTECDVPFPGKALFQTTKFEITDKDVMRLDVDAGDSISFPPVSGGPRGWYEAPKKYLHWESRGSGVGWTTCADKDFVWSDETCETDGTNLLPSRYLPMAEAAAYVLCCGKRDGEDAG